MKMFKTLKLSSVFVIAGLASAADYSHALHVSIPFAFVVAGQQFSPGDYEVKESNSGVVTIQGEGNAVMVITSPQESSNREASSLLFTKAGGRNLLSVAVEGQGSRSIPLHMVAERKLSLDSR